MHTYRRTNNGIHSRANAGTADRDIQRNFSPAKGVDRPLRVTRVSLVAQVTKELALTVPPNETRTLRIASYRDAINYPSD
jgi:hypothetical protein